MEGPQIEFALDELKTVLQERGITATITENERATIRISKDSTHDKLRPEGFEIIKKGQNIQLVGYDSAGVLYGGLELAEQIRLNGLEEVTDILQNPYLKERGTKFNIPLDMRTPSYTDASDTAQKNIPVMWDFEFWKEYIDQLARYRFNYISLWSLHPFPSLVKVPDYEDIALNDVQRSTADWNENYHLHATGLDTPKIFENPETIKKISIEEKIEFWKKVMRYGKQRNIDFHIITWNIFTNGTFGKYGITDGIDNEITKDYFRKSIKQLFLTYPDLKGIGLTTGENMPGAAFEQKENWAFDTYAKAVLEAASEMPDRRFTFIHRQHQTGAKSIAEKFKPVIDTPNIDFLYCFKYAKAHVYSATQQPYHEGFLKDIGNLKTIWGLRNDDTYYFRWGAPDFVREFISNLPIEMAEGIYFGSDQWIWGREFLTKNPIEPGQLEIDKHWYQWMLWGRLAYDPKTKDERLKKLVAHRFRIEEPQELSNAWQNASMVYPLTTGFHWGEVDFKWYIEGCQSRPGPANNKTGFHDVNRFITLPPHPKSGFQSIPDYVKMVLANQSSENLSPLGVSEKLHLRSDKALERLAIFSTSENKELQYTVNDIRSMAYMGKYYAHKIAGATHLAMYRQTMDKKNQERAVEELIQALEFWKKYTAQALKQNKNPLWTNRVGHVDWQKTTEWVENDIAIANKTKV